MSYPIKAVIFDWAGTVMDFGCMAPVESMRDAFAAHGLAVSDAEIRAPMGRAKRDHVGAILADPAVAARWSAAHGAPPTAADGDAIHDALEPLIAIAAMRCATLIPGAAEIAAHLRGLGVRIGSGTGYSRQTMTRVLPLAAAQGYAPEIVVCAGETRTGRPAPFMAWKALSEMNIWPAQACIKVDDATVGMEEGRLAGCWTIGLAASGNGLGLGLDAYRAMPEPQRAARVAAYASQLKAAGADYVVDTIADIAPIFETIARRIEARDFPR
jgi:phosphonoacetaldehyde hydrolase